MQAFMARASLCLVLSVIAAQDAAAGGVKPYFESSANQKPRGDAGVSVTGDRLKVDAGVAMRGNNRATQMVPQVRSAFSVSDRLGVETLVRMSEWNSRSDLPGTNVDTKVHFRSPAPFLDELEGRVWRSPGGQSGRILKFGFYQTLRESNASPPLTLRSRAVIETRLETMPGVLSTEALDRRARRVALETELRGLVSSLPGSSELKLKLDRSGGFRSDRAKVLAYNHSWNMGAAVRVGFNMDVRNTTSAPAGIERSVGIRWQWDL
jgi:hypothetical protein